VTAARSVGGRSGARRRSRTGSECRAAASTAALVSVSSSRASASATKSDLSRACTVGGGSLGDSACKR
jgi:hypothetical protein